MASDAVECRFCGLGVAQDGSVIVESRRTWPREPAAFMPPRYVPFAEEWGPPWERSRFSHPQCFADSEGSAALIEAVAVHDASLSPQRSRADASELLAIELTLEERAVLERGLSTWGGPAHPTREMAIALGFDTVADLHRQGARLGTAITDGEPLSRSDWTRALLATEVCFSSNVLGAGLDWAIVTGLRDEETIAIIRVLQRKLGAARAIIRPGYRQRLY